MAIGVSVFRHKMKNARCGPKNQKCVRCGPKNKKWCLWLEHCLLLLLFWKNCIGKGPHIFSTVTTSLLRLSLLDIGPHELSPNLFPVYNIRKMGRTQSVL